MKSTLDTAEIAVECPHCHEQRGYQLGRLRREPQITCAACGASIPIDGTDLDKQLRDVERRLANLTNEISLKLKL